MSVSHEVWEVLEPGGTAPLSSIVEEQYLQREIDQIYDRLEDRGNDAEERRDLRDIPTYAIDPAYARDRDDAVSIQRDYSDGVLDGYTAHVHIVDVPEYVENDTIIDRYAQQQGFTIYGGKPDHMLPQEIVDEIGFVEQEERLANTIECSFDADGHLEGYDMYRSIVNVDRTLSYDEADHYVKQSKTAPWAGESAAEMIRTLEDGAFLSTRLAEEADRSTGQSTSHRIIDEFMIKANEIGANELLAAGEGLYRIHTHEGRERNSQPRARYAPSCKEHQGLGVPEYAHLTSPLRRYPDLVNWRIIRGEDRPHHDLDHLADHLNRQEQYIDDRELEKVLGL